MKKLRTALAVFSLALALSVVSFGQSSDPGINPGGIGGVVGEVVAVDANAKQLFVKTDGGSVLTVALNDATSFRKLPPGETAFNKSVETTFSEVGAGDRVFARGTVSDDKKVVAGTRMVILMTKADLAKKHEADRMEWRQRGASGVITALNPETREITIQPFGAAPAGPPQAGGPPAAPPAVVIAAGGDKVRFRRYAPDSVKFADAKASRFEDLKIGDQLRAKGEKSADGTRLTPEEVVSGSFRTVIATVKEVNAATRELQIVTLEGNRPMTVVLSKDSELKQVPAEFAQMMMGGAGGPGGAPGAGGGQGGAQRAPGGPGGAGGGQAAGQGRPAGAPGEGGPRRMGGGISEMLERLPPATIADIKPNSMIVFSTTGDDPAKVMAVQLVAGIDPIVQMMQMRAAAQNRPLNLGAFNLGIGQP